MSPQPLQVSGREAIVFGGAGFIGSHLARDLARRGARITIADIRKPVDTPDGARFVPCDVRGRIDFEPHQPDPLVFNLAAIHRTPGHPDHEYFETNIAGARNVTDFCSRHGTSSLWFASSISVYGPTEDPVNEDSALRPTSAYGKSKAEAEQIHREWLDSAHGRHLVIVRPAAVFGPGENGNFTRLAKALGRGLFFYPGRKDTLKACGYVEDLVESLHFMYSIGSASAIYNFAYPTPPTLEAICKAFHEVGGTPRPRGTIPTAPMLALARALSVSGLKTFDPDRVRKLVASTNVEARNLVEHGFRYGTDLRSAIERWRAADPKGQFV